MDALARLPVFFALDGKRALLAGGSAAAAWKAELLSAAGAQVDVYRGRHVRRDAASCRGRRRAARSRCIGARGAPTIWPAPRSRSALSRMTRSAAAFAAAARAAGVPVNVIDKPAFCDFSFGAIVNRSPLVIGISTDGAAPVFAQAIRAKLEALIPQGFARWAEAARALAREREGARAFVRAAGASSGSCSPRMRWPTRTARRREADFDAFVAEVRGLGSAVDNGSVTLVGAGPGDPELLTLRAVRALQSADVILFDDLVSRGVLDFARREAKKMLVGKTGHGPSCKQDEINALMVALARQPASAWCGSRAATR